MDDKMITSDDIIMVRWGAITVDGIERAEAMTTEVKNNQGRVAYYAVVPSTAPIPDEAARRRMSQSLKLFQGICDNINLVFEGRGLKIAAARSVAASIFLVSGNRKMCMFSSLEEALQKQRPADAVRLTAIALQAGIYVPTA